MSGSGQWANVRLWRNPAQTAVAQVRKRQGSCRHLQRAESRCICDGALTGKLPPVAGCPSNQPHLLQTRMAVFADDDVVMHGDAKRNRDVDDRLGYLDVRLRWRRVARGVVMDKPTISVTVALGRQDLAGKTARIARTLPGRPQGSAALRRGEGGGAQQPARRDRLAIVPRARLRSRACLG